jgi:hypothetical protein
MWSDNWKNIPKIPKKNWRNILFFKLSHNLIVLDKLKFSAINFVALCKLAVHDLEIEIEVVSVVGFLAAAQPDRGSYHVLTCNSL